MVLVGGLVLIVGGMFWLMSGGLDSKSSAAKAPETPKQAKTPAQKSPTPPPFYEQKRSPTQKKTANQVDASAAKAPKEAATKTPPFAYENQADFSSDNLVPPPESYEQNIKKLAKQRASAPQKQQTTPKQDEVETATAESVIPAKDPIQTPNPPKAQTVEVPASTNEAARNPKVQNRAQKNTEPQGAYVCKIMDAYKNLLGKEIMYYLKDESTHKYVPAYSLANWDESGVVVKKRLIATQVDLNERMVEVSKGMWIPALEFMRCTLMQEDLR